MMIKQRMKKSLSEAYFEQRMDFELFKSSVCHKLKALGDIDFIIDLLESDCIRRYYDKKWYPESLYLLAMLDYISRQNHIEICTGYDDMRSLKLKDYLFPAGIIAISKVSDDDEILRKSLKEAIPEFMRFHIVESEVRNVV